MNILHNYNTVINTQGPNIVTILLTLTSVSSSKGIIEPPNGTKIYKDSWDFGPYLKVLNAAVEDEIFLHSSWIKEYFTWAGFKDYNLVVRVRHQYYLSLLCYIMEIYEIPLGVPICFSINIHQTLPTASRSRFDHVINDPMLKM